MTTTMTTTTTATSTTQPSKPRAKRNTQAQATAPTPERAVEGLRLSIAQADLKRGLARIGHAVAGKSTLPILSNVLLASDGERLKLTATDLAIAVTVWLDAQISEAGTTTLPSKLLADVVGALPNDTIDMALDPRTETTRLECGQFEAGIKGIEAAEFPVVPTLKDRTPAAEFAADVLRATIRQVALAAATSDSRPSLAGVRIRLKGREATFAAADGFRMAICMLPLATAVTETREVIVPASALHQLGRLLGDVTGTVAMIVDEAQGHVLFATTDMELMTRVIDGKYPDVDRIIPRSYLTRTVVETAALSQAVRLAGVFAASGNTTVRLSWQPASTSSTLTIHATAAEVGDNTGQVAATIDGEAGTITLNAAMLADAISAVGTSQIAVETQTSQHVAVFKPVGAEGYLHLVMPMTTR